MSKVTHDFDPWLWTLLWLKFRNRNRYRKKNKSQKMFRMLYCSFVMFSPKWFEHSVRGIARITGLDNDIYGYNFKTVRCREIGFSALNMKLHDIHNVLKIKGHGIGSYRLKQKYTRQPYMFGIRRQRIIKWNFHTTWGDIFNLKVKG